MAYFDAMGAVWYTLKDGSKVLINDITTFATIAKTWKTDARVTIPYQIRDGELPHMISHRLYGTVDYWWTVLLANDIYDLDGQWPRSTKQLSNYIARKYNNAPGSTVHHYLDPNGLIADILSLKVSNGLTAYTDAQIIDKFNLEAVTIQDFEVAVNEVKRNIVLIDPDYIGLVQDEFESAMGV